MRPVNSDALDVVARALDITGSGRGAPTTEFEDGILDQVIDVLPMIRRGRTQGRTQGLYTAVLSAVHAGADDQLASEAPYAVGTGVIPPYPDPIPRGLELWLLTASVRRFSGSGTVNAILSVIFGGDAQGWGIDSTGSAVVSNLEHPIAHWDAVFTTVNVFGQLADDGGGSPLKKIGLRLPHPTVRTALILNFRSTSSAAMRLDCQLLMGLFPISLGQDGIV